MRTRPFSWRARIARSARRSGSPCSSSSTCRRIWPARSSTAWICGGTRAIAAATTSAATARTTPDRAEPGDHADAALTTLARLAGAARARIGDGEPSADPAHRPGVGLRAARPRRRARLRARRAGDHRRDRRAVDAAARAAAAALPLGADPLPQHAHPRRLLARGDVLVQRRRSVDELERGAALSRGPRRQHRARVHADRAPEPDSARPVAGAARDRVYLVRPVPARARLGADAQPDPLCARRRAPTAAWAAGAEPSARPAAVRLPREALRRWRAQFDRL